MRDQTGLKSAELVRGPDKKAVHRRDPAALFVRSKQLDQGMPHHYADVVEASAGGEHEEGKPEPMRQPKTDGCQSKTGDGPKQGASGFLKRRAMGENRRA